MEYNDVERALYRLGGRAEARYSRPRPSFVRQGVPGPASLPRSSEERADVHMALRRLTLADRQMVLEHYVTGARQHPPRLRRVVVKKLLAVLR